MQIIDGKLVSETIKKQLAEKVTELKALGKKVPHLAAILVGTNPASETYVASKVKSCAEIGYNSTLLRFDAQISEQHLLDHIRSLNENADIDGILVQLPLPKHINEELVINTIDPNKDVDGFHPANVGRMVSGLPTFIPATPYGIMLLLEHYRIPTKGKHAVVIGRSHIVGTPMSILLSRNSYPGNCTVTICHSQTTNLKEICLQADIIVAAIGRPDFVTADMVKEGVVIIDVGINRIADATKKSGSRLVGDVNFKEVSEKASFITPVPGGVGPMTIAALLKNTYFASQGQQVKLN
ncbi:methenyltetrahydrofolate cyclohydrolase /5,10-methylenetetrahydrofolate dehydrogenase (NADP+) [Chitinophaga costaii]|uniref:Bifunctional protein FolD n=1 Tax=Chitinophaga costaii TaxID=1335309 RepID=A0A1C4BX85_9BACT|nr:bifunctional methylenetetrahydrofolate dehydrogenase/methenyltetrahydrofolate cyclohydrolase FolD [Chitinophaga costaii]PUZ27434.1 bifunctional methylenetetrahydrofolate dehydrogenase/methenyltetrahydrofolate cyclohydrolase FolD [Chitinophaga costaii]SCC11511.1 methenyltetrahydrofolate cyclohydrolase /5,10-methylenetetrahydrofolate dehydrogenase (NADP+) [Chitinophaga costaii]